MKKLVTKKQINYDILVYRYKGNSKPYFTYEYICDYATRENGATSYEVDENSSCFAYKDCTYIYETTIKNKKEFINFLYEKLNNLKES